jgi:hypothetical protein
MTAQWQPYREPLRATVVRTVAIALVVGVILARSIGGGLGQWPLATLLVLWPSFGGHWVELWFLDWLRPRLPAARITQAAARLAVWFVSGIALALGMELTALALAEFQQARWPAWWIGGLGFVVVELVAHVPLQLRGRPSFYNGRG